MKVADFTSRAAKFKINYKRKNNILCFQSGLCRAAKRHVKSCLSLTCVNFSEMLQVKGRTDEACISLVRLLSPQTLAVGGWALTMVHPEPPLRLLSASDLQRRITQLEDATRACRAELQRRPSHCQEPPPPQPATAASSCMLIRAEFPSELLVQLAETLGNPLALLVSKAHLSKAFCKAARTAQATLTTLELDGCYNITDTAVVAVTSACKRLTSLNLCGCHNISDAAVEAVASECKQLTSLTLHYCYNITDAAVQAVVSACPHLTVY